MTQVLVLGLVSLTSPESKGNKVSTINTFRNHLIEIESILGDMNSDGVINIHDIIILINHILEANFDTSADINSDGELDVLDVILLVNIILE